MPPKCEPPTTSRGCFVHKFLGMWDDGTGEKVGILGFVCVELFGSLFYKGEGTRERRDKREKGQEGDVPPSHWGRVPLCSPRGHSSCGSSPLSLPGPLGAGTPPTTRAAKSSCKLGRNTVKTHSPLPHRATGTEAGQAQRAGPPGPRAAAEERHLWL